MTDPRDDDIESLLERLAADPPTVAEARALLEASGRYDEVEVVPSDARTETERLSDERSEG